MNDITLYELTVDQTHINLMIKSLSNFMCASYDAIDLEVVDKEKAMEEIKVASDIQLVLKHQLGKTRHTPKQTSQHTGLVWCKEINLDEYCDEEPFEQNSSELKPFNDEGLQHVQKSDEQRQKELNDSVEYAKHCLDTFLKNQPKGGGNTLTKAWNNVKERHWDTIKRTGEK